MSSLAKQIACVAAYAAGFAVGSYGALKLVEAIEAKCPTKKQKGILNLGPCRVLVTARPRTDAATATIKYANGRVETFGGTKTEVNEQLKEHGLGEFAI